MAPSGDGTVWCSLLRRLPPASHASGTRESQAWPAVTRPAGQSGSWQTAPREESRRCPPPAAGNGYRRDEAFSTSLPHQTVSARAWAKVRLARAVTRALFPWTNFVLLPGSRPDPSARAAPRSPGAAPAPSRPAAVVLPTWRGPITTWITRVVAGRARVGVSLWGSAAHVLRDPDLRVLPLPDHAPR
jgi:hypothetical protein